MTLAAELIATLADRGLTVAVAESLTGGLLIAELIGVPGASAVVLGGVVAYNTELKHTVVGVDEALLAEHGAVHPEVARQMADRIRTVLAVGGRPADVGLATTGVAGPQFQDGHPAGIVHLGIAIGGSVRSVPLSLTGGRDAIRRSTVAEALGLLRSVLAEG